VHAETSLEWLATLRGRIGAAMGPEGRFLPYVTGGAALAGVESSISGSFDPDENLPGTVNPGWCDDCTFGPGESNDDIRVGYAVGAGGEYAFTNRVSLGLQYLYMHFEDDQTSSITFHGDDGRAFDVEADTSLDDVHSFTARLNVLVGSVTP
jgi:opacity protein-like surface antigen